MDHHHISGGDTCKQARPGQRGIEAGGEGFKTEVPKWGSRDEVPDKKSNAQSETTAAQKTKMAE